METMIVPTPTREDCLDSEVRRRELLPFFFLVDNFALLLPAWGGEITGQTVVAHYDPLMSANV